MSDQLTNMAVQGTDDFCSGRGRTKVVDTENLKDGDTINLTNYQASFAVSFESRDTHFQDGKQ